MGHSIDNKGLGKYNGSMAIEYKPFSKKEQSYIRQLYETSFPQAEKKPFSLIVNTAKANKGSMYSIFNDRECVGLLFTMENESHILIDYLAIDPRRQGEHIGSEILAQFFQATKKPIVLEIEALDRAETKQEYEMRKKREAFYLRSGMHPMNYKVNLFGVEMEILACKDNISYAQYVKILRDCIDGGINKYVKKVDES